MNFSRLMLNDDNELFVDGFETRNEFPCVFEALGRKRWQEVKEEVQQWSSPGQRGKDIYYRSSCTLHFPVSEASR